MLQRTLPIMLTLPQPPGILLCNRFHEGGTEHSIDFHFQPVGESLSSHASKTPLPPPPPNPPPPPPPPKSKQKKREIDVKEDTTLPTNLTVKEAHVFNLEVQELDKVDADIAKEWLNLRQNAFADQCSTPSIDVPIVGKVQGEADVEVGIGQNCTESQRYQSTLGTQLKLTE